MCEILAPAGDINGGLAAINAGADAVYLGLKRFSARSSAENFDLDNFESFCSYAHAFGVKVYVAMNTLIKDRELDGLLRDLTEVWNKGADAIILSDVFLGKFIKQNFPQVKLHLSTQAGVCNLYAARFAKKCGFDRVILSRETSFDDIKKIAAEIETEVFVQGALCTCFSGQCYMSSFAGGNSGNRGKCKQPCRKRYSIDRNGFEDMAYRLSLSDLSVGENIKKFAEIGVKSFKIEGRLRRAEYVSAAVGYYRDILDGKDEKESFSRLKRTFNRGNYTRGLAFGQDKNFISSAVQGHIGEFAGAIKVVNGQYFVPSRLTFKKGDAFKVLRGGKEVGGADFLKADGQGFIVTSPKRLLSGDKIFVTTDTAVNGFLLSKKRKIALNICFMARENEPICVDLGKVSVEGAIPSAAEKRPLSKDDVINCFKKVDKYPFEVNFKNIELGNVFVPAAALNEIRRKAYKSYFEEISKNTNEKVEYNCRLPQINSAENRKTAAICRKIGKTDADIVILKPDDYSHKADFGDFSGEKFLYLPPYATTEEADSVLAVAKAAGGIYCDGLWAFGYAKEHGLNLFAGTGLNISNAVDVNFCEAKYFALSKELTPSEQKYLAVQNAFSLSLGGIKVMDLVYCPFEKKCSSCDKRNFYSLTDEDGRVFPIRRYKFGGCRFEVYNCSFLVGTPAVGALVDCTPNDDLKLTGCVNSPEKQKNMLKNYTYGRANSPVL